MSGVDLEKLRRMYQSAPINSYYKPEMSFEGDMVRVKIQVREDFFHAGGAVHGSLYFKMLDDTAWFAACIKSDGHFVLTADFNIHLIRPVSRGVLVAEGEAMPQGGRMYIGQSQLTDDEGRLVGLGRGTFTRSSRKLGPECGYR